MGISLPLSCIFPLLVAASIAALVFRFWLPFGSAEHFYAIPLADSRRGGWSTARPFPQRSLKNEYRIVRLSCSRLAFLLGKA